MDPTAAIPLHFTLQAVGVAASGLVLAWGLVRGRVAAATGAALLCVAEGLHAGRWIPTDDDPLLVVLRLAGVAAIAVVALRAGMQVRAFAAGGLLVAAGALWGAAGDRGIAEPSWGPHLVLAAGFVVLAVWAWGVSRDSVRLRVLTGLVAMLAITVVVGGAAVSRVAALDKSNEQVRQLGAAATAVGRELSEGAEDLTRRAALLSPQLAGDRSAEDTRQQARAAFRPGASEAVVVVRPGGTEAFVAPGAGDPPISAAQAEGLAALESAVEGRPARTVTVAAGDVLLAGAAPMFRPGSQGREPEGAVGILRWVGPAALRASARAYAPGAEVVAVDRSAAASDPDLLGIQPAEPEAVPVSSRVQAPDRALPATTVAVGDGTRLVVVGSDEGAVGAVTGLLRALLIAILAAALLAVVVALWLSDRVTRPILDLAESAERVKADFLSSVSHELRTPLTPIRGYTEMLRRGRIPARRASDYLDEIGDAALRLERIVTLLLDVSALEAGRFAVSAGELHPREVLEDAARRAEQAGAGDRVEVSAAKSLPRVLADADAVGRALDELVDNAVKFSPDGTPVRLRAVRSDGGGVEFSVSDEGEGVSAEQIGEWTAAFTQADTGDRRRYGGLGLGLAYVAGVLAAHGSQLSVTGGDGGTTFAFTLPAASMVSPMPEQAAQAPARPAQRPRRAP